MSRQKRIMPPLPVYRFDPSEAFPELSFAPRHRLQETSADLDPVSALTLTCAYIMSGQWFKGTLAHMSMEEFHKEFLQACFELNVPDMRVINWAKSLLIPAHETLIDLSAVPQRCIGKDFTLHPYQRRKAGWAAYRMGCVQALGCGVGKSATAMAAARAAVALGRCQDTRCYIVCPLNAMPQWRPYLADLRASFKEVQILSVDSLHKYRYLSRAEGGAVIFDEVHKVKNWDAQRSGHAHEMRSAFEWGISLTGTLLHTGAEGVLSMLDVSCPGLSRYMDKWAFGEDFNCIYTKQIGRVQRRSLGRPAINRRAAFTLYLTRAVCSLDYESEEVKSVFTLPEHTRADIETWEKPKWLAKLEDKEKKVFFAKIISRGGIPTDEMYASESSYRWPPEMALRDLFAASAISIMKENIVRWETNGHKDEEGNIIDKPGLPSFPMVMHRVSKEGNINRVFLRTKTGEDSYDYEYYYAPGSDCDHPAPGPKIKWLMDWLKEQGDLPAIVGAASVQTLDFVQEEFKKAGISYRLIRGGIGIKDRDTFVREFQEGKFRIMLLQQVAGSESVTLTNAFFSVLLDADWSPITYTQFMRRIWRQGQDTPCVHYDLAFNTLQSQIITKLASGVAFDAETRHEIERLVEFDEIGRDQL